MLHEILVADNFAVCYRYSKLWSSHCTKMAFFLAEMRRLYESRLWAEVDDRQSKVLKNLFITLLSLNLTLKLPFPVCF